MEAASASVAPKLVDELKAGQKPDNSVSGVLSKIILLEGDIRKVTKTEEFGVLSVNESHKVIPYFQCFMWRKSRFGKLKIQAVSGASTIDEDAPSILSVVKIIKFFIKKFDGQGVCAYEGNDDDIKFYDEWAEILPPYVLWCEFIDPIVTRKNTAGLVFFRESEFTNKDVTTITPVLDAYRYTWYRLPEVQKENRSLLGKLTRSRIFRWLLIIGLVALMFLPVRESVLAPATILPKNPIIVGAPISGVVDQFHVQPNQVVTKGDLLISLDDRDISNEVAIATKELETAKAEYLQSAQKSFSDEGSKSEIELRKARVSQKVLEKEFAESRLAQTKIFAGRDGVAVYSDENDWLGKPVSVGEKIMTLANPDERELGIYMPIDDALYLEPGAEVRLFLNTEPTKPLNARLFQTSYEPSESPSGITYFLKAKIEDEGDFSRLGWQGTAKIYSNSEVTLFYYLFRKPISSARQLFGF